MMIEIHGGGFGNKGAELMLSTVLQKIHAAHPDVSFCMSPSTHDPRYAAARYGLQRHFPFPVARGGRLFSFRFTANRLISACVPRAACEFMGVVRYQDIDALIDVSGIRYGDAVGDTAGRNLNRLAQYYRASGKPVILLPQMLGPFSRSGSVEQFRRLLPQANLVFARDKRSFEYASKIAGSTSKLRVAPDITVFCEPHQVASRVVSYGCIVPNVRIFDRGTASWAPVYIDRLTLAAEVMLENGIRPTVLIHSVEGDEDRPLANELIARLGSERCTVETADDPLELKGMIGGARLLVGSRYHSIVSALSSGVPAIALGWAHKYDGLLDDFKVPDLSHHPEQDAQHLTAMVARLCSEAENARLKQELLSAREAMRASHDAMWQDVFRTLRMTGSFSEPWSPEASSPIPESRLREPL